LKKMADKKAKGANNKTEVVIALKGVTHLTTKGPGDITITWTYGRKKEKVKGLKLGEPWDVRIELDMALERRISY